MSLSFAIAGGVINFGLEQNPSRLNQSATTNLRNINKIEHDT